MQYEHIHSLDDYVERVDAALLREENRRAVNYPQDCTQPWLGERLREANQALLAAAAGEANVYAIFTAEPGSTAHTLRYIGKSTRALARQRLTNHLFQKHEKTGAKLDKITALVQAGGTVKVAWLRIEPESLRNYIEEELIQRHPEAHWNRENRNARR